MRGRRGVSEPSTSAPRETPYVPCAIQVPSTSRNLAARTVVAGPPRRPRLPLRRRSSFRLLVAPFVSPRILWMALRRRIGSLRLAGNETSNGECRPCMATPHRTSRAVNDLEHHAEGPRKFCAAPPSVRDETHSQGRRFHEAAGLLAWWRHGRNASWTSLWRGRKRRGEKLEEGGKAAILCDLLSCDPYSGF